MNTAKQLQLKQRTHFAHRDDVHCIIPLSSTSFASGSKDTSVALWNRVQDTYRYQNLTVRYPDYTAWVTSMAPLSNRNTFVAGARNGMLQFYDYSLEAGIDVSKEIDMAPYVTHAAINCKERNKNRILSILEDKDNDSLILGIGSYLLSYSMIEDEVTSVTKLHEHLWAYEIKWINGYDKISIAIGSTLCVAARVDDTWKIRGVLLSQNGNVQSNPHRVDRMQKPFISSTCIVTNSTTACSCFDGTVKVIDMNNRDKVISVLKTQNPVNNRVWQVERYQDNVFFSCDERGSILLWDVRVAKKPSRSETNLAMRVSKLLKLNDTTLVSAYCHSNPSVTNGAVFNVYDVRI
jgi:WD40 repeat protein